MRRRACFVLIALFALVVATAGVAEAHPASAYVRVEPQSGSSGDEVRVIGGDWYPESRVEIRWESPEGTLLGETMTDSPPPELNPAYPDEKPRARFETYVTIPEAPGGRHVVYAVGIQADGDAASPAAAFEIVIPAASEKRNAPDEEQQNQQEPAARSGETLPQSGEESRRGDARSDASSHQASTATSGGTLEVSAADGESVAATSRSKPAAGERIDADAAYRVLPQEHVAGASAESTGAGVETRTHGADPVTSDRDRESVVTLGVALITLVLAAAEALRRNRKPAVIKADVAPLPLQTDDLEQEREAA